MKIKMPNIAKVLGTVRVFLLLALFYSPLIALMIEGGVLNRNLSWAADANFYGEYLDSSEGAAVKPDVVQIGSLNSNHSSWASWKINALLLPFMNEKQRDQTWASVLIKDNQPKSGVTAKTLKNDGADEAEPTGYTYSLFPPQEGYVTFYGKFFPNATQGWIKSVEVFARNTGNSSYPLHFAVSSKPGDPSVFEETLIFPAMTTGWQTMKINEYWNYSSLFIYVYMDPIAGTDPLTYPLKIGWDQGKGRADAYFTVNSVNSWQLENARYRIRLQFQSTSYVPSVSVKLNENTFVNASLIHDAENFSTISPEQFYVEDPLVRGRLIYLNDYKYFAISSTFRIPINLAQIKLENVLNITVSDHASWNVTYVNLWFHTRYSATDQLGNAFFPYPVIILIAVAEFLLFALFAKRLRRWMRQVDSDQSRVN